MDADALLAPVNVDRWTRDRWGRPLVVPPGGGKPVPYGRPSGFGIVLEDRFGLNKWQTRMAVLGVTQRPDLAAQIAAASDDATRDALIEQAQEAAGASSGANLGSALHTFTEHVDLGRDITVPAPWDADVEAYKAALAAHGIEILPDAIELDIVCDELELAGTCDRIVRWDGRLVMADLKTGKKIADPALGYSVQLAVYANSLRYTHGTGERHDLGVDTSVGLIIHLPAGQARCDIHAVDLVQAWELALLARAVKQAQKRKGIVTKVAAAEGTAVLAADDATATPDSPAPAPGVAVAPSQLVTQLRDELAAAITAATDEQRQRIAAAWPPGLGRLSTLTTREELQAVQRVVVDVVGIVGTLDVPSAEQLIQRLSNLPGDLLAAVEAEALAQHVPNLRGPHVRPEHLAVVARLCDEAGAEHARRVQEVAEALGDLDVDTQRQIMFTATDGRTTWPDELLELEAERVVALAAASTWLVDLEHGVLLKPWVDVIDKRGGKQAVVTAAKALAVPHGRPMPKSAADVAADPVLAALVAASSTPQPTQAAESSSHDHV